MYAYMTLLLFAVGVSYFGRRFGSAGVRVLSLFIVAIFLVLFAGFRDVSVGTDTYNYVSWLSEVQSFDDVLVFDLDKGFGFIVLSGSLLSDGYALYLMIIAFVVVTFYLVPISRMLSRYELGIFVFVALGFYTFFFNGARQGVALAICFSAMPWLLERKFIPYFLAVACAALFHKTALVALPLYFIAATRVGWRELLLVVLGVVVLSATLSSFAQLAMTLIDARYASYGQAGEGGGEVQLAFLLGQGFLLLYFRKQVGSGNTYYARLLNIYLVGLVPAIASVIGSVNPSGVLRLTTYFSHTAILLWPMVLMSFRRPENKAIVAVCFYFIGVAYFILTTSAFSELTPYQLNSELFG